MTSAYRRPLYLLAHVARAIAPHAERRWIDAMFAELDAVEPERRGQWIRGSLVTAWSAVSMRMRTLPSAIWGGMVLATSLLVLFSIGSRTETEVLLAEDDIFVPLAWCSGAVLVGLGILAINWIFNHTEAVPRNR
jgi:hypothetical protein